MTAARALRRRLAAVAAVRAGFALRTLAAGDGVASALLRTMAAGGDAVRCDVPAAAVTKRPLREQLAEMAYGGSAGSTEGIDPAWLKTRNELAARVKGYAEKVAALKARGAHPQIIAKSEAVWRLAAQSLAEWEARGGAAAAAVASSTSPADFRAVVHRALRDVNKSLDEDQAGFIFEFFQPDEVTGMTGASLEKIDEALVWLNKHWSSSFDDVGFGWVVNKVPPGRAGRAYYSHGANTVYLSPTSGTATVIHELGHRIEHLSPQIHREIREFMGRRFAGEKIRELSWGGEIFVRDKLAYDYMGRLYPEGLDTEELRELIGLNVADYMLEEGSGSLVSKGRTEILSVGLQKMYEDPMDLYTKDEELFWMVLRWMTGGRL